MNRNTKIIYDGNNSVILKAIRILRRDMDTVFYETEEDGDEIFLIQKSLQDEQFEIKDQTIYAGDELGFVYAILHISRHTLNIPPFWFWYDYKFKKKSSAEIKDYVSAPARVRFRGWFLNDEILLSHWSPDADPMTTWEMAFEALLRCGGNMVIPTTQVSRKHSQLASSYGLWLTHHHAEPLGADMFSKVYPGLDPAYLSHQEEYNRLWIDGIKEQENQKVIWNIGFRGQGDMPFWAVGDSLEYDTDQKRGALISKVIKYQYDLLHKMTENPICCTYIYGEITSLYKQGFIQLPEDVIKIWSDNGYGKMVSRRIGEDNPRISELPDNKEGLHGIYYHISYCDLQSCAHITQIGNRIDFLEAELENAFAHGADDYLILNCSNIRPHIFPMAMIADLWCGRKFQPEQFAQTYFGEKTAAKAFLDYAAAAVKFGPHEDEHAGDHFYNFNTRALISCIMKNQNNSKDMVWATGEVPLTQQLEWFGEKCEEGEKNFAKFLKEHTENFGKLYDTTIMLHGKLHYHGYRGGALFVKGCMDFLDQEYLNAFYRIGLAGDEFEAANLLLRDSEYGPWKGYYANECFADFKFTAYLLRAMMTYVRNFGEGAGFYEWQRELFYNEEDKGVRLQLNLDNRDTSEAMFAKMKACGFQCK